MLNNNEIPKIMDRKDAIILGSDKECKCGRLKDKPHCPACGRIKLYAMAETKIAMAPGNIAVNNCKTYRCLGCGEKFNDVDWYFECHAPIKIDWQATKKLQKEQKAKEATEKWLLRIEMGERFTYNDRTQCKAETGFDPEEMRQGLLTAAKRTKNLAPEVRAKVEEQADKLRKVVAGLPVIDIERKGTAYEEHVLECSYCMTHDDNCPTGQKLKEES